VGKGAEKGGIKKGLTFLSKKRILYGVAGKGILPTF
jgi:hypothetical protein